MSCKEGLTLHAGITLTFYCVIPPYPLFRTFFTPACPQHFATFPSIKFKAIFQPPTFIPTSPRYLGFGDFSNPPNIPTPFLLGTKEYISFPYVALYRELRNITINFGDFIAISESVTAMQLAVDGDSILFFRNKALIACFKCKAVGLGLRIFGKYIYS